MKLQPNCITSQNCISIWQKILKDWPMPSWKGSLFYNMNQNFFLIEKFSNNFQKKKTRQQYFGSWEEVLLKFQQDILYLKKYLKCAHNYLSRRSRVFSALESVQKQLVDVREKKNSLSAQLQQIQKNFEEAKATEEKEKQEREKEEAAEENNKLVIQKKPLSKKAVVLLSDNLKSKAEKLIEQWSQLKKETIPTKVDELKELNRTLVLFQEFEMDTELKFFKQRATFFMQRIIQTLCNVSVILSESEVKPFLAF